MKHIISISQKAGFSLILSLFIAAAFMVVSPAANAQSYYNSNYGYQYMYPNQYSQYQYSYSGNRSPIFKGTPSLTTAKVGLLYTVYTNVFDPDNDRLTFSLELAPDGMTINPESGLIRWTPNTNQGGNSYAVTVAVSDRISYPVRQTFYINVQSAPVASASIPAKSQAETSSKSGLSLLSRNKKLEITNVLATSGPRNINNSVSSANCNVVITWNTTVPSAGQVVFGPTSQPNADTFNYGQAAVEGSSLSTRHQVALPTCLSEQTYYFRVIAFTNTERVVSDEKTILPIPIEIPSGGSPLISAENTASVLGTVGKFIVSPIVIVIILAAVIFFVVRKFRGRSNGGHGGHSNTQEPVLNIPHH